MAAFAMNMVNYITMTPLTMSTTQSLYMSTSLGFVYNGTDYPLSPMSQSMLSTTPGGTFERAPPEYQTTLSQSNMPALSSGSTTTFERAAPDYQTSGTSTVAASGSIVDFVNTTVQPANTASLQTLVAADPGGPMARFLFDPIPYPQPPPPGAIDVGRFRKTYPRTQVRPKFRKYIT